ncbi:MAG: hypothetical protein LBR66_09090 [Candidatus Symbiothrix sp.]|nr:hypothetical protein [Candidatus Symbiothrix sp.]
MIDLRSSYLTVEDCIFKDNTSDYCVILLYVGSMKAVNTTFIGNENTTNGYISGIGAITPIGNMLSMTTNPDVPWSVQFINCIIDNPDNGNNWFESHNADDITLIDYTVDDVIVKNTLSNSYHGAHPESVGNILVRRDATLGLNDDGTLTANSPAINTGGNDGSDIITSDEDLAGNPREVGSAIDMGAYEWQASELEMQQKDGSEQPNGETNLVFREGGYSISPYDFHPDGVAKVVKTFATDQWHPIGFPFDIAHVLVNDGVITVESFPYIGTEVVPYDPNEFVDADTENAFYDNFFPRYLRRRSQSVSL